MKNITPYESVEDPVAAHLRHIVADAQDLVAQATTLAGQAERALRVHLHAREQKAGV